MYPGTFLPADEDEPWSVAMRERLRGRFIEARSMRGVALEADDEDAAALECYLRGIDADPIVESYYLGLMRCYERLGKRSEAISAYRRLRHTLSVLLGAEPSDGARRLFQSLLGGSPDLAAMERGQNPAMGTSGATSAHPAANGVVRPLPLPDRLAKG